MWLKFIRTCPSIYDFRMRCRSLVRREIFRCRSHTRHQCARNVVPIATLHPRVARSSPPRIVCVQRRGANAWHDKVLQAAQCTRHIVAAPRIHQSNLTALLQQFRSLIIFHVFFTVFRFSMFFSHSSTEHLHVTRSYSLQRDISKMSEGSNISLCLFVKMHCSHSKLCSSHLLKNSFSARSRSRNSIYILSIISIRHTFHYPRES